MSTFSAERVMAQAREVAAEHVDEHWAERVPGTAERYLSFAESFAVAGMTGGVIAWDAVGLVSGGVCLVGGVVAVCLRNKGVQWSSRR